MVSRLDVGVGQGQLPPSLRAVTVMLSQVFDLLIRDVQLLRLGPDAAHVEDRERGDDLECLGIFSLS